MLLFVLAGLLLGTRSAAGAQQSTLAAAHSCDDASMAASPEASMGSMAGMDMGTPMAGDPANQGAVDAVKRLRADYIQTAFDEVPVNVMVTGKTAGFIDLTEVNETYTPIVFLFVLGLSFVLLTVAFRSIVIPIKAILMNLLSVGATYGPMVLVFQKGVGADLLGFQQVEVIQTGLPLFLFAILFGLSMDYHVFLPSRVRERFIETGDNTEAVAHGLRSTSRLVTGAALIMVAVFGGFALGDLVALQQLGFGLAFAVLIDATIVRSILVPAAMALLGDRNWYLPHWLSWLPDLRSEGSPAQLPAPSTAPRITGSPIQIPAPRIAPNAAGD